MIDLARQSHGLGCLSISNIMKQYTRHSCQLSSLRRISYPQISHRNLRQRLMSSYHQMPTSRDRGPVSEETTQTDFGRMDVLGDSPSPSTAIDACLYDGFHLNNGLKVTGGNGLMLIAGEAFSWRPWSQSGRLLNSKGQFGPAESLPSQGAAAHHDNIWGILELCWPKPEMLILGLGKSIYPLAPTTRQKINSLGIRVDVADTRNAAAQFNLLATERGVGNVAAAFIPLGWKEPKS